MLQYELISLKGKKNFDEFFDSAIKFYEKDAALFISYKEKENISLPSGLGKQNNVPIYYSCVVRKKNAKKAVVRNRIKRLIRVSVRQVFKDYSIKDFESGISALFIIWAKAPEHPKLINLSLVHPVVTKLMNKAETYYQSEWKSK